LDIPYLSVQYPDGLQNFNRIYRDIKVNLYISACEMGRFPSFRGIMPAFQ